MLDGAGQGVTVGPSILGLITSGFYDDPLAVYREYIQNAVDELSHQDNSEGKVEITIDPSQKKVCICDNGPGLTYQECLEELLPIAQSKKSPGRDRGFRGIGRLAGLAFAESVTFLTRSIGGERVTRVVWSGTNLIGRSNPISVTGQAGQNHVSVETLDDLDYPEHFFKVELDGISRHAAGLLLNREAVRGYISEVCPVPMALDFPFSWNVEEMFKPGRSPYSLRITLDGELQPIWRQYGSTIDFAGNKQDHFREFEQFRIPCIGENAEAAIGWIAHSSYLGAIPKANRVRGVRARVGNIQVGDERVFDHLFDEDRFNRWCVGEVHILDPRIVPNAGRDYFEREPHLRDMENHLAPIFRQIAIRCRAASSNRNKEKRLAAALSEIEDTYELAATGFLGRDDAKALVRDALHRVSTVRERVCTGSSGEVYIEILKEVEKKLNNLQIDDTCFPIEGVSSSEVLIYQRVFRTIVTAMTSPRGAQKVIEAIFRRI